MSNEYENLHCATSSIPEWASKPEELGRKLSLNVPATLRDQFAMAALNALMLRNSHGRCADYANEAYKIADAMIEARKTT